MLTKGSKYEVLHLEEVNPSTRILWSLTRWEKSWGSW